MDKNTEQKISELQMIEQNLQQLMVQKQNSQMHLVEVENALEELKKNVKEVYKIVGQVMINTEKSEVEKDLNSKKEMLNLKISKVEKREEKFRESIQEIQKEILEKMNKR